MKGHSVHSEPDAVAEALDRLSDELTVLRDVLDEIRSELQWANRNREDGPWKPAPVHITSMPRDPTAPDWAERLNRFSAADLPGEDSELPTAEQGHLF